MLSSRCAIVTPLNRTEAVTVASALSACQPPTAISQQRHRAWSVSRPLAHRACPAAKEIAAPNLRSSSPRRRRPPHSPPLLPPPPRPFRGDRFGRRPPASVPTASHAPPAHPARQTAALTATASSTGPLPAHGPNLAVPSPSLQPPYPASQAAAAHPPTGVAAAAAAATTTRRLPPTHPFAPQHYAPSPFRSRTSTTFQRPLQRLTTVRLWNPTNSTPRSAAASSRPTHRARSHTAATTAAPARRRAPSTPPPPAVALFHPVLHGSRPVADDDPIGTGAADYPLLTLPEQRQVRHSTSTRASLQVDRAGSEKRVSLPRSIRHSYDGKRLSAVHPTSNPASPTTAAGPSSAPAPIKITRRRERGQSASNRPQAQTTEPFGLVLAAPRPFKVDKGKGKMAPAESEDLAHPGRSFLQDLERGPDVLGIQHGDATGTAHKDDQANRNSTVSMPSNLGIGSAISSSNSSIMGDPDAPPDVGEEWGPQHPCYPHRNPHVPADAPEYVTTRIIRIRRDWLVAGDLAPTFSNLYPEILDPAGMPEQEFRRVVDKLNKELVDILEPWKVANIVDGFLGLLTGWLWEDLGLTSAKRRLAHLERWIEQWNETMAHGTNGSKPGLADEGPVPPKIIPLRETGYMTLDIQIGDPEIAPAPASTPATSNVHMPLGEASPS